MHKKPQKQQGRATKGKQARATVASRRKGWAGEWRQGRATKGKCICSRIRMDEFNHYIKKVMRAKEMAHYCLPALINDKPDTCIIMPGQIQGDSRQPLT